MERPITPQPPAASDAQRFARCLARLHRPQLHEYVTDSADFYRWYQYGGNARPEPLTMEQLSALLHSERGYTREAAHEAAKVALPACEWRWFKELYEAFYSKAPVWQAHGQPTSIDHYREFA